MRVSKSTKKTDAPSLIDESDWRTKMMNNSTEVRLTTP